jgi:hypothetical protein
MSFGNVIALFIAQCITLELVIPFVTGKSCSWWLKNGRLK